MTTSPTRTIPIARADPKRLQLEADEAQLVLIAEVKDHMFYNRLVNGMRERQEEVVHSNRSSISSSEQSNTQVYGDDEFHEAHNPSLTDSTLMTMMSQSLLTPSFVAYNSLSSTSSSSPTTPNPAGALFMPKHPPTLVDDDDDDDDDDYQRAQLSSALTQSLQIIKQHDGDDLLDAEDEDNEELMFEMEF